MTSRGGGFVNYLQGIWRLCGEIRLYNVIALVKGRIGRQIVGRGCWINILEQEQRLCEISHHKLSCLPLHFPHLNMSTTRKHQKEDAATPPIDCAVSTGSTSPDKPELRYYKTAPPEKEVARRCGVGTPRPPSAVLLVPAYLINKLSSIDQKIAWSRL